MTLERPLERDVKRDIKKVLDGYGSCSLYWYMPVPSGYGASTLDYLGFIHGYGFAVEAKRPGKRPDSRQKTVIARIRSSGAKVFVIDGTSDTDTVGDLDTWLATVAIVKAKD